MSDVPATPCPLCGSYTGTTLAQAPALLAVCDVLVVRALEAVGKRIVRVDRSRHARLGDLPVYRAHTLWQPAESLTDKALAGAWDVVPAMLNAHGCCGVTAGQVTSMMDDYVRDLLLTGRAHNLDDLCYRFSSRLSIQIVPHTQPYDPDHGHEHDHDHHRAQA